MASVVIAQLCWAISSLNLVFSIFMSPASETACTDKLAMVVIYIVVRVPFSWLYQNSFGISILAIKETNMDRSADIPCSPAGDSNLRD